MTKDNKMIKLAIFDFDGVFTDGKIYFSSEGQYMVAVNVKDTMGLLLLKNKGIKIGILSGTKLNYIKDIYLISQKVDFIITNCQDKKDKLSFLLKEYNITRDEVAYIGDDLNDIDIMSEVGLSATPNDGIQKCKDIVTYICENKGGQLAVREFCEHILINY